MKQFILIVIIIFLQNVLLIFYLIPLIENNQKDKIKILQSTTDYRHLTSVIYIDLKGDTVASDYLTYKELSNLN